MTGLQTRFPWTKSNASRSEKFDADAARTDNLVGSLDRLLRPENAPAPHSTHAVPECTARCGTHVDRAPARERSTGKRINQQWVPRTWHAEVESSRSRRGEANPSGVLNRVPVETMSPPCIQHHRWLFLYWLRSAEQRDAALLAAFVADTVADFLPALSHHASRIGGFLVSRPWKIPSSGKLRPIRLWPMIVGLGTARKYDANAMGESRGNRRHDKLRALSDPPRPPSVSFTLELSERFYR